MDSDNRFDQKLISDGDFLDTNLLCFVKIKTEHISLLQMKIIEISGKLLFSSRIVSVPPSDFQLEDKLFPTIVNDQIHALPVPCFGLYITVSHAIYDRL